MKISILLPYKENFSPTYPGAVSLFVKDTVNLSKYKKNIIVYGNTNLKKIYNLSYKNIFLDKKFIKSGSKVYVNRFLTYEKKEPSDLIEIHNRPNYFHLIYGKFKEKNIILYFHNDPLTMTGSRSVSDRVKLLSNATKIVFNSHWSRKRFLENIEGAHINSEKIIVIYQSTTQTKVNLSKKKKWFTFVGKLNRSKGYDLFGSAAIKVLKKFKDWNGLVIGDEPRAKLNFKHPRLKILGFRHHKEVLKVFEKTSIAVACSRWDEPLGRTSLEASSRGCATIISDKGGLPETVTHGIILRELTVDAVYKSIVNLIENKKKRLEIQKLSLKHFYHTNIVSSKSIDKYREALIKKKFTRKVNITKEKRLRILHITNFNERHDGRLFFNTGRRLNNGFIRLGHSVLEISDRDITKNYKGFSDLTGSKALNKKIINTAYNYKPDLLIFGHADQITGDTLMYLKDNYRDLKIAQWFLDPLVKNGPDYEKNKLRILNKIDFTDANFMTTSPDALDFLPKKNNSYFMPNPTDSSFEVLNNYENKHCSMDVFFALSHGVHRGILKRGKYDERADFVNKLVEITPNVKFDLYGINNVQPIWADTFIKSISNAKMGVNLSRGAPIKYYSSDRITQLIGNGLLTFIHKDTNFSNFFSNKEVIFYSNINDLSEKIQKFAVDEKMRKTIAKNGKKKYMKHFNSTVVADYIIKKTFTARYKKNSFLWDKK